MIIFTLYALSGVLFLACALLIWNIRHHIRSRIKQASTKDLLLSISFFWIFMSLVMTTYSISADKLQHIRDRMNTELEFAETCEYRGGLYQAVENESGSFDGYCLDSYGKKSDFYFEPYRPISSKEFILKLFNRITLNMFE